MKFSEKKWLTQPDRWSEPTLLFLSDVVLFQNGPYVDHIISPDSGIFFISCTEAGKVFVSLALSLISLCLSIGETEGF